MDPHLQSILIIFLIYGLVGAVPLYWASCATSRVERLCAGLTLICYAVFMLTGLVLVTGTAESIKLSNINLKEQLTGFMPYTFLTSFIFTFLFGGVGTNIVTSANTSSDNIDISNALNGIERKLNALKNTK